MNFLGSGIYSGVVSASDLKIANTSIFERANTWNGAQAFNDAVSFGFGSGLLQSIEDGAYTGLFCNGTGVAGYSSNNNEWRYANGFLLFNDSGFFLNTETYIGGPLTVAGDIVASNIKSISAYGAKSGSIGTLGVSGTAVYKRTLIIDGVTVQVVTVD